MERRERGPSPLPKETVVYTEKRPVVKEERKWFVTISNATFEQSIKYIRLAEGLPEVECAKELGITRSLLYRYEKGTKKPYLFTLNTLIDGSPLDPEGKAAQLLRLKLHDRDIMTYNEIESASLGELVSYLRIVRGMTRTELGKPLGLTYGQMSKAEIDQRLYLKDMSRINTLLDCFAIDPQEPLAIILRSKVSKEDEDVFDDIQKLASGKFLFQRVRQSVPSPKLSEDDRAILEQIDAMHEQIPVGQVMKEVRILRDVSRKKLEEVSNHILTISQISNLETRPHVKQDYLIVLYMQNLGYDIHHPITHRLLAIAEMQRTRIYKKRTKI